jgi:hypothetical protein
MKSFILLLAMTLLASADMAKVVNLELFDNQNPAIITDIEDEQNHVVVNFSFEHHEKEEGETRVNTQQQQYYNAAVKTYRRFDDIVLYLKAFQTIRGVQSDPTSNNVADIDKTFSSAELGVATTLLDDLDLGISYSYELTDDNSTLRNTQLGLRYVGDINLAALVGMRSHQDDLSVKNDQIFYRVGLSRGETSYLLFDMSLTYRPPSSSSASGGLLANNQPKTYEGVLLLQGNEDFLRGGIRFEYLKSFPILASELPIYSRKIRYHKGMKVEREENSFSIFFISYERKEQGVIIDHEFALGVSLRGFYD